MVSFGGGFMGLLLLSEYLLRKLHIFPSDAG